MSELGPISVYPEDGRWVVDYISYARGFYATEAEAVATATKAALDEGRELLLTDRAKDRRRARPTRRPTRLDRRPARPASRQSRQGTVGYQRGPAERSEQHRRPTKQLARSRTRRHAERWRSHAYFRLVTACSPRTPSIRTVRA